MEYFCDGARRRHRPRPLSPSDGVHRADGCQSQTSQTHPPTKNASPSSRPTLARLGRWPTRPDPDGHYRDAHSSEESCTVGCSSSTAGTFGTWREEAHWSSFRGVVLRCQGQLGRFVAEDTSLAAAAEGVEQEVSLVVPRGQSRTSTDPNEWWDSAVPSTPPPLSVYVPSVYAPSWHRRNRGVPRDHWCTDIVVGDDFGINLDMHGRATEPCPRQYLQRGLRWDGDELDELALSVTETAARPHVRRNWPGHRSIEGHLARAGSHRAEEGGGAAAAGAVFTVSSSPPPAALVAVAPSPAVTSPPPVSSSSPEPAHKTSDEGGAAATASTSSDHTSKGGVSVGMLESELSELRMRLSLVQAERDEMEFRLIQSQQQTGR
mmetsp:Transcript_60264/g.178541  ORF Transcript_60264/g.178541 Transcript_60264/m.178541 type:complete len:377 (-) Transcript_60264:256-1386(-)